MRRKESQGLGVRERREKTKRNTAKKKEEKEKERGKETKREWRMNCLDR